MLGEKKNSLFVCRRNTCPDQIRVRRKRCPTIRFGSSLNYLAAWKLTPTVSYPAAVITLPTPWVGARVSDAVLRRGEVGGSTWPGSYHGLSVPRYGRGTYPSLSVSRYGWAGRFAPSKSLFPSHEDSHRVPNSGHPLRPVPISMGSRPQATP